MVSSVVLVDDLGLLPGSTERFAELVGGDVRAFDGDPASVDEVVDRIGDAALAVVSWRTKVPAEVFARCPNLRYVGLAASAYTDRKSSNIDLDAAATAGVVVSTLAQYGDEATAEWVLMRMLMAAKGLVPWRGQPVELHRMRLGVVGMGHMGRHVARRAVALGMSVSYTGPRQKPEADAAGYVYTSLPELLASCDVVTVHTPKGTAAVDGAALAHLRPDALLINTSLGPAIDTDAVAAWLRNDHAAFACDDCVDPAQRALAARFPNAAHDAFVAGDSVQMWQRKAHQLLENLAAFLSGSPIRQAV